MCSCSGYGWVEVGLRAEALELHRADRAEHEQPRATGSALNPKPLNPKPDSRASFQWIETYMPRLCKRCGTSLQGRDDTKRRLKSLERTKLSAACLKTPQAQKSQPQTVIFPSKKSLNANLHPKSLLPKKLAVDGIRTAGLLLLHADDALLGPALIRA